MAYKQWIGIKNRSRLRRSDIRIKDAKLESGKFYRGNKDNGIGPSEINKIVIAPQSEASVHSCGRSDADIGTEGQYTLDEWNVTHETKIYRVYWSAPWGAHSNVLSILDWDPNTSDYSVIKDDVQQDSTIGNVEVVMAKLA
ncbi:Asp-hemolysin [Metarhizium brunneum]|uniref:Asp-hemolysin n=1 Tax=Metarhizium brunneum TaxID=500148 RepID=A0A7D5V5D3_9HYPO